MTIHKRHIEVTAAVAMLVITDAVEGTHQEGHGEAHTRSMVGIAKGEYTGRSDAVHHVEADCGGNRWGPARSLGV